MDRNKLKVLKEIGYKIPDACWNCKYSVIIKGNEFGQCQLFLYPHAKHTGEPRVLSVHRGGHCDQYERSESKTLHIHGFAQFLSNPFAKINQSG